MATGTLGIGDISLLINLGATVTKILHSAATTAPQGIGKLARDVNYMQATFFLTMSTLEEYGAILRPYDDLRNGIIGLFSRCERTLQDLELVAKGFERIAAHEGKVPGNDTGIFWERAFKSYYTTINWTTMDDAINHIRQHLAQAFTALQLTMQSLKMKDLDELRRLLLPVGSEVHKIYELVVQRQIKIDQLVVATPRLDQHRRGTGIVDLSYISLRNEDGEVVPWIPPSFSFTTMSFTDETRSETPSVSSEGGSAPARVSPGALPPHASPSLVELKPLRLPPPYLGVKGKGVEFSSFDISAAGIQGETTYKVEANPTDQGRFIESVIQGKTYDKIPVLKVSYVRGVSSRQQNLGSAGDLFVLHDGTGLSETATSVWIFNVDRTVRAQQKLPVWDPNIPYTLHGQDRTVKITQETSITFYTPNLGLQGGVTIPTSEVTYDFCSREDCKRFQQALFGWELLLSVGSDHPQRTKKFHSGELLTRWENIRLWQDPLSHEVKFMARLPNEKGWRTYLEFNINSPSIRAEDEGPKCLKLEGLDAPIAEELDLRRSSASSSESSTALGARERPGPIKKITIVFPSTNKRDEFKQEFSNMSCRRK